MCQILVLSGTCALFFLPYRARLPRLPNNNENDKVSTVAQDPDTTRSKSPETRLLLFLLIFLFPLLSIALVGGYGFIVWISQLTFLGPPGPG